MAESPTRDFAAPLDELSHARLVFPNGIAPLVTIRGDNSLEQLFSAHFDRPVPNISLCGNDLVIQYKHTVILTDIKEVLRPPQPSYISLNISIPWEIMIQGGAGKLNADLREIHLKRWGIHGGASEVYLMLPHPTGTVPVSISQGAANVTIYRPRGVPFRVQINGGATNLILDDHSFGAVGGITTWVHPDYKNATDRFDIKVGGGATNLTIGTVD